MSRELVGYLAGVMIEAGADTTSSWLQSLVLAVAAFPETLKVAQVCLSYLIQLYWLIMVFDRRSWIES
jgi:hypothetical protein